MYKWQQAAVNRASELALTDRQRNAVRDVILAVNKYRFPAAWVGVTEEYQSVILFAWTMDARRWEITITPHGVCTESLIAPGDRRESTFTPADAGFKDTLKRGAKWLLTGEGVAPLCVSPA